MTSLQHVISDIKPLQEKLKHHSLYTSLTTMPSIFYFMSHHVYCVWDFMNLLKTLQRELTCVEVPWKPVLNPTTARLINEIALEEESDVIDGKQTSHFMYYVSAIRALNPENEYVDMFLRDLHDSTSYKELIEKPYIPSSVQTFLTFTYHSIQSSLLHTAATFTFGREALVPDLFLPIVSNPSVKAHPTLTAFVAYLERHIELDGDHHSELAYDMMKQLCKTKQDWLLVTEQAKATLKARLALWDAIVATMPNY